MKILKLACALFLVVVQFSCGQKSIAYFEANIGENATRARIRFSTLGEIPGAVDDGALRVRLSNADGDFVDLVLSPTGSSLTPGEYTIDGTENSFDASITITSNQQPTTVSLSSPFGVVNVSAVAFSSGGQLNELEATFNVNLEGGGAGEGWINYASGT